MRGCKRDLKVDGEKERLQKRDRERVCLCVIKKEKEGQKINKRDIP